MWPSATGAPLSATLVLFVHVSQLFVLYYGASPPESLATLSIPSHTAWTHILEEPDLDSKIRSMFKIAFMFRAKVTLETSTSWTIWKTPVRPTCIAVSDHLMPFQNQEGRSTFHAPLSNFFHYLFSIYFFTLFGPSNQIHYVRQQWHLSHILMNFILYWYTPSVRRSIRAHLVS